jgi:ABC-2 type transport system permease protein
VAVAGLVPRRAGLAWGLFAVVLFQTMLGDSLRLPDAVNAVSQFWHLPGVPAERLDPVPGLVELGLAAALVLVGLWAYRRRDVTAG